RDRAPRRLVARDPAASARALDAGARHRHRLGGDRPGDRPGPLRGPGDRRRCLGRRSRARPRARRAARAHRSHRARPRRPARFGDQSATGLGRDRGEFAVHPQRRRRQPRARGPAPRAARGPRRRSRRASRHSSADRAGRRARLSGTRSLAVPRGRHRPGRGRRAAAARGRVPRGRLAAGLLEDPPGRCWTMGWILGRPPLAKNSPGPGLRPSLGRMPGPLASLRRRFTRVSLATALLAGSLANAGCAASDGMIEKLYDSTRAYNRSLRWGDWDRAAEYLPQVSADAFIESHQAVEDRLVVLDYQMTRLEIDKVNGIASSQVEISWHTDDHLVVRTTTVNHLWQWYEGRWVLVDERRS